MNPDFDIRLDLRHLVQSILCLDSMVFNLLLNLVASKRRRRYYRWPLAALAFLFDGFRILVEHFVSDWDVLTFDHVNHDLAL